jgi:tetratricopeptide (TPR) repeat protein
VKSSAQLLLALVLALSAMGICFAANISADVGSQFDAANKLYEQGTFANAASAYESLVQSGTTSPALYFNYGNALFKSGHTGRAIAAYRQAEQLTPRDPDLLANLQFARNNVQGATFRGSTWERWLAKLSLNEWTLTAAAAVWLLLLLLAVRQIWPKSAPALRGWTAISALAAIVFCSLLGCVIAHRQSVRIAVVTQPDATIRTGPFEESPGVFTAKDGAELRVLDSKDGWLQVTAGERRIGWVKRESVSLPDKA